MNINLVSPRLGVQTPERWQNIPSSQSLGFTLCLLLAWVAYQAPNA